MTDCRMYEVNWPVDVTAAAYVYGNRAELAWLDSPTDVAIGLHDVRYSLIAANPVAHIVQMEGQPARLTVRGELRATHGDGWELWRAVHRRLPTYETLPTRLGPGWIGYVGFEMARQLERLPASRHEDLGLPLLRVALYDRVIVLDHQERRAWAIHAPGIAAALRATEFRSATVRDSCRRSMPHAQASMDENESSEQTARQEPRPPVAHSEAPVAQSEAPVARSEVRDARSEAGEASSVDWIARWNEAARATHKPNAPANVAPAHETPSWEHENAVRRALDYIAAGDIYQVNLAHRIRLDGLSDPFAAYAALRRGNPAPYGALLRWNRGAVASVSPELFLRVRDRNVLTSPIKGTRPRTHDEALDVAYRAALVASAKDAAELAMIVDLHRNDLGRVCEFGSIKVAAARRVEAHPSVFHTVADVVGRLTPRSRPLDLLKACFPAGSITGVPKIRALQIIDELESVARDVYTGAIGTLGLDGQMTFNVAIRTLQIRGDVGTLYVGGGIVADSDPADEYAETLAKARGILAALTNMPVARGVSA